MSLPSSPVAREWAEEAGVPPPSGEQRQEREGEPGDTVPFGPERHRTASELWAYEQDRQAYAASLTANDIQRRRSTAATLAGTSNLNVNLIVTPQQPIPDWSAVRAEMLGRLERIEASFQNIAPFLAALEAAYGERGQLGDNYPPERIEMLPLDTIEVQMGTEVAKLVRTELNMENLRGDVLRVSGLVLNQLAARTSACLSWIAAKGDKFVDAAVTSAGTETGKRLVQGVGVVAVTAILRELHVDLTAIVNQILHLVTP
jgi:hypothetical protein